jgi:alpha-1,3-rhamnosyl/mannosyltransferase
MQSRFHSDCRLVLCGFPAGETPGSWHRLRQSLAKDTVQILGYLPRRELPALYQTADLLIYPSLFEGFGLPVLEAMASGCPVICSNVASLPEIAGDAALFIDPCDSAGMATAMDRLLNDAALRGTHIAKGRERAGRFSWEATARATLSVYRRCCLQ